MTVSMRATTSSNSGAASAKAIDALEMVVACARRVGSHGLDRLQYRLYRWRLSVDPATRSWMSDVDAAIERGEVHGATSRADFDRLIKDEQQHRSTRPKPSPN